MPFRLTDFKDTLNIRPDETYEIILIADNAGKWVFHCHELHHAEGGMISLLDYKEN
ncbi:multicopper oxidase domain-containing protein [Anaerobacillus sp. HL2]|nr:multicopper oxidase domain-containing protein [Anaerobacillus sp. HL2]